MLWALEKEVVAAVNTLHENTLFLKGHKVCETCCRILRPVHTLGCCLPAQMPPSLQATNIMAEAITGRELLLVVIPTQFVGKTLAGVASTLTQDQIVVSCSKV
jgi:glycerol-3-phosphate dehydrogenase